MLKGWIHGATAATVAQWIVAISLIVAPALGQNSPSSQLLREFEATTVFSEQFEIGEQHPTRIRRSASWSFALYNNCTPERQSQPWRCFSMIMTIVMSMT